MTIFEQMDRLVAEQTALVRTFSVFGEMSQEQKDELEAMQKRKRALFDQFRAVADCKWRHAIDIVRRVDVEIEQEFDAGRVGVIGQVEKTIRVLGIEPQAALVGTGAESDENGRTNIRDFLEAEYVTIKARQLDDIPGKDVDVREHPKNSPERGFPPSAVRVSGALAEGRLLDELAK